MTYDQEYFNQRWPTALDHRDYLLLLSLCESGPHTIAICMTALNAWQQFCMSEANHHSLGIPMLLYTIGCGYIFQKKGLVIQQAFFCRALWKNGLIYCIQALVPHNVVVLIGEALCATQAYFNLQGLTKVKDLMCH